MRNIVIESSRCIFSTWENRDLKWALKLWSDPSTCKYITKNNYFTENEIKEKLEKEMVNYRLYNYQYFPVLMKTTQDFLGCCGFRPYNEDTIELGMHLLPLYWGIGLGTELGNSIIQYAFQNLDIRRIFAGHHPKNTASSKLLLKLGFQWIKEEYYPPTNLMYPSYIITKEDYSNK